MNISEKGIRLIKAFEGFRSHPYQCSAKVWTIGYGHTKGVTPESDPITEREACGILMRDLSIYESSVRRLINTDLSQNEYDALVSFTFNLGGGVLQRSTLRQKLNRGEKEEAAKEFLKWCYAGGVKSKGLLRRRQAEMELYLSSTI